MAKTRTAKAKLPLIEPITVNRTFTLPWMYPKQQDAFFNPARYSTIEASTKSGKTMGGIAWLTDRAFRGEDGQNFWWVAPIFAQSKIAYRRLKRILKTDNPLFPAYKSNDTELTLTLENGAVIWFKSGDKPDSLYGEDVWACVIDEASRLKEEAWFAVRSTLTATRGPVRMIGNVRGKNNWHYRLGEIAKQSTDPFYMQYHCITALDAVDAGILDAYEIIDALKLLPRTVFNELYMAQASDDGSNPFGQAEIELCRIDHLTGRDVVVWGLDLAGRAKHGSKTDWTSLIGLDDDGNVAAHHRFQAKAPATIKRVMAIVGTETPCYVDATGMGKPIFEILEDPTDFLDDTAPKPDRKVTNFHPYIFTAKSKQPLMDGLAISIQAGHLGIPKGTILTELQTFEYTYTRTGILFEAPAGLHDDNVCALALANFGTRRPARDHGITSGGTNRKAKAA